MDGVAWGGVGWVIVDWCSVECVLAPDPLSLTNPPIRVGKGDILEYFKLYNELIGSKIGHLVNVPATALSPSSAAETSTVCTRVCVSAFVYVSEIKTQKDKERAHWKHIYS